MDGYSPDVGADPHSIVPDAAPEGGVMLALPDTAWMTSPQVARFAGVSYRRLDYWTRIGLLAPAQAAAGSGTKRRWAPREAQIAWMLGQIADTGANLTDLRQAVDTVRYDLTCSGWLVVGAHIAAVAHDPVTLLDLMRALGPMVRLVNLDACPAMETAP